MRFHRVAAAADVAEGRAVAVEIEGRPILLVRSEDKVYALDNLCPHAGSKLDKGRIVKGAVACPLHGARFELETGKCKTMQLGDIHPIVTHAVQIVGDHIEVAITDRPMAEPQL
jgi:nitrite reductase/ring-hydroxylating ferredoxin subunit